MKNRIINGLMIGSLTLSCACSNIFTSFSDTTSDEALAVEIQKDIDASDYNSAILLYPYFSTAYQADPAIKRLMAQGYLGRAGLNFFGLLTNFGTWNPATTSFFLFLLQNFDNGKAATISDSWNALSLIASISSPSTPTGYTNNELTLMAMAAMTTMGNIASAFADPAPRTGAVQAGFTTACTGVPPITPAATDPAVQFGVAFNLFLVALTSMTNSAFPSNITTLAGTICGAGVTGLPHVFTAAGQPTYNFCGLFTAAAFTTAAQEKGVLSLINEGTAQLGLNPSACGGGTVVSAGCFCP